MTQIKLYETVYTTQDLEYAAQAGAEGFSHVSELEGDGVDDIYVFSKEQLDSEVINKLAKIAEEGWVAGDTFYGGETEYEIIA